MSEEYKPRIVRTTPSSSSSPGCCHSLAPYILAEHSLELREGSPSVRDGSLRARTGLDYLVFSCPDCDSTYLGGGIGWEGVYLDCASGLPKIVVFRIDCDDCGFRDFFKIAVDERGLYGTAEVEDPADWARRSKQRRADAPSDGELGRP